MFAKTTKARSLKCVKNDKNVMHGFGNEMLKIARYNNNKYNILGFQNNDVNTI